MGYVIYNEGGARDPKVLTLTCRLCRYGGDPLGQCQPGDSRGPRYQNPNPVKIAAAIHMAGAYNLKKVLPRHVL